MGKDTFFSSFTLRLGRKLVRYDKPCVMGILNITDDSFYDGGLYVRAEDALRHARLLLAEGADIIDVGASSSRPGATLLDPATESRRLTEVIGLLRSELPEAVISADTCYASCAEAAIAAGADIINDIGGGQIDDRMFDAVATLQVPYILTHTRGLPHEMDGMTHYDDLPRDLALYFSERLAQLHQRGVSDIIIDPGFGFAKGVEQCHYLLRHLDELTSLFDEPLLAGMSRKRMAYEPLATTPQEALNATTVLNTMALERGARLLRVHDPRQAREAIRLLDVSCR